MRYMLFGGDSYEPSGGMNDFQGYFPSVDAAREATENKSVPRELAQDDGGRDLPHNHAGEYGWTLAERGPQWYHIYDTQERKIVEEGRS